MDPWRDVLEVAKTTKMKEVPFVSGPLADGAGEGLQQDAAAAKRTSNIRF